MGSVGNALDNALCESIFATLETELIGRRRFATQAEAQREVFGFIEAFYNTRRSHSALGYISPVDFDSTVRPEAVPQERGACGCHLSPPVPPIIRAPRPHTTPQSEERKR